MRIVALLLKKLQIAETKKVHFVFHMNICMCCQAIRKSLVIREKTAQLFVRLFIVSKFMATTYVETFVCSPADVNFYNLISIYCCIFQQNCY